MDPLDWLCLAVIVLGPVANWWLGVRRAGEILGDTRKELA